MFFKVIKPKTIIQLMGAHHIPCSFVTRVLGLYLYIFSVTYNENNPGTIDLSQLDAHAEGCLG